MGFEPKTLMVHCIHAYPLTHQGHKQTWTCWKCILKVKCEVIKETVSARKDQCSLPWDLNPRPWTFMVHMLIHWAIRDTRKHKLVENASLRLSVRSLKRHNSIPREIQQGPGGLVYMHGILSPDPSGSNLAGGSVPHACFLACKTC